MLATQTLNANDRPLYGAFIRGGLWQFAVLEGNQYAVSRFYDATNETELFKIFFILKRCKSYIEAWINELTD